MSSLRQIAANRRNALKSTGPITAEGKERSRGNALRHGLTAETVIAALEDADDYQAFEAAVIADYDAETAVERELVLRLASILWRLRRATGIETALFVFASKDLHDHPLACTNAVAAERNRPILKAVPQLSAMETEELNADSNKRIADCFLRLIELPTFPLDRLSRYERVLWRQARQIVLTLETLRRRKRGQTRSNFPSSFRRRKAVAFLDEST